MMFCSQAQTERTSLITGIALRAASAIAISAALGLAGCGSGVSNLLPVAATPNSLTPSGPTLGYVFNPVDGTLRALLGVRGSARVSASIVPAGVYVSGDASTASNAALLEDETGSLFAFKLPLSQPAHVADGLPAGSHIVFAPSGETAIAYATGASTVALITGLPGSPVSQTISISGGARISSATVSDTGTIVAASQGSSIQVGTLSPAGQFSRFATVSGLPSFSFFAGSDDMLLTDGGANTLSLVHSVSSSPMVQAIGATGLNKPVGVAGSQDRHWAAVANGADSNILRVDLTSGTSVARLACSCQPTLVSSLAGNAVFRVNALGTGPVWTVDLSGTTPQLLFVPAIGQTSSKTTP